MKKQKTVSLAELQKDYKADRKLGYFPNNALKRAIAKQSKEGK